MEPDAKRFTKWWLVQASLRYFGLTNLAILLGAAVGAAVLTGSLLVGDSLNGSLAALVCQRLGTTDHALAAPFFFQASLAERLAANPAFQQSFSQAEALLALPGNCSNPAREGFAGKVNVFGRKSLAGGGCIINELLAGDLGLSKGGTLVLRLAANSAGRAEAPIGGARDVLAALRLTVLEVAPLESVAGSFSLYASQRSVRNVWVSLADLQAALDAPGGANLLLAGARPGHADEAGAKLLQDLLAKACTIEDYGLRSRSVDGTEILESANLFLNERIRKALGALTMPHTDVFAYLANTIKDERTGRQIPYSMVAGIGPTREYPLARPIENNSNARDAEINLNQWAADELQAQPGDRISLSYFIRGGDGLLAEHTASFLLNSILPMKGLGADASLVPEFKGLTNSQTMAKWNPPRDLNFDFKRLRPADEDYWTRYRAAPKAFISLAEAQKLWGTRYGALTSARIPPYISQLSWREELAATLSPAEMGLVVRPIRAEQLAWAGRATDFGMLFIGFSFFLIISAALLVALLMRLAVEQRARQMGLLAAIGFSARTVRRLLLLEGALLLLAGCALGSGLAVGVAELMLYGLRTVWNEAIGTQSISLHISGPTLLAGFAASAAIGMLAIWRGAGRLQRGYIAPLLSGSVRFEPLTPRARFLCWAAALAGLIGALALAALAYAGLLDKAGAFFGAGACFLAGALAAFGLVLNTAQKRSAPVARWSRLGFALRNAGRNPARSLLAVGLLAAAALITLVTGAMKEEAGADSGSDGGYNLICTTAVPLPHDLSAPEGRRLLGFGENSEALCRRVQWTSLRASAGEDTSCRNLAQSNSPRVLGVSEKFIAQGGFAFSAAPPNPPESKGLSNPWLALRSGGSGKIIPAVADAETAEWILHKNLGEYVAVQDEFGGEWQLQLVALLRKSIFQSELLISAENFNKLFPSRSGFDEFLLQAAPPDESALRALMSRNLSDFGVIVESSQERLAAFARIANTYISAFQALGGLGLFLGSLGLLVVLSRSVFERRGELALLTALGFTRSALARLLVAENGGLLACGLALGALAGALASGPEWLHSRGQVRSLLLVCGMFGAAGAVILALLAAASARLVQKINPEALRRE